MNSLSDIKLECNNKIRLNFKGGELSSDGGLFLLQEFYHKIGFNRLIKDRFKTNDTANRPREHTDDENLNQVIHKITAAYFTDDNSDELRHDPVLTTILDKEALASQPTLSRFHNRMDNDTLDQFNDITKELRRRVYSVKRPKMILLDLDSTLLETYGNQEGEGFNYHYGANGYHPLVCFEGLTGDLLKAQLRRGSAYSSNGIVDFMQPLLDEYQNNYPGIMMFSRGDSAFALPELFTQYETNGVSYAIRIKANANLHKLSSELIGELEDITKDNIIDYAVVYGEFYYQANTWDYPRRIICKVEKPQDQIDIMSTFIVTNMNLSPEQVIAFYRQRGHMENFVKECKNGFDFGAVSSSSEIVNSNRFQIHVLAYNLFNWFRRLVLPAKMRKYLIDTIRLKMIKIAVKMVHSGRYVYFKLSTSCPYKNDFYITLENIKGLRPQLE